MRNKEHISQNQLGFMIVLFEIGSTPLFMLGASAKQDAWLAMALAAMIGLLLLWMFLSIHKKQPRLHLIAMLPLYWGRPVGIFLSTTYVLYFAYESMRNVRDFGELTSLTLLSETPMAVTMLIVIIIGAYAVYSGVEVIFRIGEILLVLYLGSSFLIILFFFIMKVVHFEQLLPMLENGVTPVLKAAFPDIVSFPFGQIVIFLMFWHFTNEEQGFPAKTSIKAYIFVSCFLIFTSMLNIAILGPTLAAITTIPFLQSIQLISLANVLERMDVLITLLVFVGLFMKMIMFYLCTVQGLSYLTSSNARRWTIPAGIVIYASSLLEPNYTSHVWVGLKISVKFFPIFQIIMPLALWVTILLRRRIPVQS